MIAAGHPLLLHKAKRIRDMSATVTAVNKHFSDETDSSLSSTKPLRSITRQRPWALPRTVILGPISFLILILGKAAKEAKLGFQPISPLPKLLPSLTSKLMEGMLMDPITILNSYDISPRVPPRIDLEKTDIKAIKDAIQLDKPALR
ncbi:uncharacterized protein B0H18DRAFT_1113826 [Fomitopsis serialis]|uniref:uncharacterized protein n=1 Tax=Fomitopsis serialis TaxID=139415 RepID=UPI0020089E48|nr:uncharacterized protein B0H18DRAFT_1113826 [Neoantrodia serialis]KAH9936440.1 hypothetical protein B0H18DRAFT_1113826 [Neoantrodia serialis]